MRSLLVSSVVAAISPTTGWGASVLDPPPALGHTFDLKEFGAVCDGVHDDTKPIQAWLDKLAANVRLSASPGVCLFSAPLRAPYANAWAIVGSGPYSTVFKYVGGAADVDLLTINDTGHGGFRGGYLSGFRIMSETRMTGGAALHVHGAFESFFSSLIADGLGGNGNLFHGLWFDGVGFASLDGFVGFGRGDGIRVNGALGGTADLYVTRARVKGFAIGLHVGGGIGGVACDMSDFNQNGVNLQIDNAIVHEPNREVNQGRNCAFDAAVTGDNVFINDELSNGGTVDLGGWIASSFRANGVNIQRWRNGDVEITGDKLYNNCLDGLFVQDPTTHVFIGQTVAINKNGNAEVGHGACQKLPARGFGVNAAEPTDRVVSAGDRPWNNSAGPFGPNVHILGSGRDGKKN